MITRVRDWLNECLAEAERQQCLVIGHTRLERSRLQRAASEGLVLEVVPNGFAGMGYWQHLSASQRVRQKACALQQMHPEMTFAGPTAAIAHGLSVSNRYLDSIWLRARKGSHRAYKGRLRHILVSKAELVEKQGIRVTSLERTVGDCLRLMDFRSGLAVADSALRKNGAFIDELIEKVNKACFRMSELQRVRAVIRLADGRAESGGESIARATMMELGLLVPDLQRWFDDPLVSGQRYRADFVWDIQNKSILGELDGNEKYTNIDMTAGKSVARLIEEEHRRQSHIETRQDVLRFIRFGFADIMDDAEFLRLLLAGGVPRTFALDDRVCAAGGVLRCR